MIKAIFSALPPLMLVIGLLSCSMPAAGLDPESPVSNLTPVPTSADPYAPQPGDDALQRGPAHVEDAGVLVLESYPPQFHLHVSGNLPDPCHELRIAIAGPDAASNIAVDVYTVVDPSLICIQVLKPFAANADLGTYPAGHYTVTVNGEPAGEFDSLG